ncbi:cysteine hydrolase family protein [Oceanobacter sp. 3_MG-2023]|uniref:cysteine hydrolase family protein n=1 Tax=Oceanobacter sp. 3_MG-2023 TaxID=3062622 RepID=UPI002734A1D7|nr:isochorismatase family cysteine hydrolase [Oceanobacter sp. 3_MG-2023]MDP2505867.1 isochorismatase family cysteine hydrolase [Oceanobacter sp. 3_MG-2023]
MLKKVEWAINPRRTALIIVDMQKIFCEQDGALFVPSSRAIIAPIKRLSEYMRAAAMPVIYLRHVVRGDGSDTGRFRDLYPDADAQFARSNPAIEVIDELQPQDGDIVVDKLFYSGFHNTDLDMILRMKDIDTLIVCGTVTNVCCETTMRDGVHREYRMIALSDANAAMPYPDMGFGEVSADEVQRIALTAMAYEFGEVTNTADLMQRIHSALQNE